MKILTGKYIVKPWDMMSVMWGVTTAHNGSFLQMGKDIPVFTIGLEECLPANRVVDLKDGWYDTGKQLYQITEWMLLCLYDVDGAPILCLNGSNCII